MCLEYKKVESLEEPQLTEDVMGGVYIRKDISTRENVGGTVTYCYDECFLSDEEYKKSSIYAGRELNKSLQNRINALELKRVRAIAEPGVKNKETGETYLEAVTKDIQELRKQMT